MAFYEVRIKSDELARLAMGKGVAISVPADAVITFADIDLTTFDFVIRYETPHAPVTISVQLDNPNA
jgi:hypothetical protein